MGFAPAFFDRFGQCLEGLREAQQAWIKLYDRNAFDASLKEAVDEATAQRSLALDACTYHLRRDPQAMVALATIREGEGHDDLIFDVGALSGLMRDKKEAFSKDETIEVEAVAQRLDEVGSKLSDLITDTDADVTRDRRS